tara:strand:- start:609 stop:1262 length:654 start_codon:yes stop_codon:yes gene_type:complete
VNNKQKANLIRKRLDELYPNPPIPLNHTNNFTLLIAVLLSAQSTDKKVNELTINLFNKASTPEEMVKLGESNIYEYIKQLGLSKTKSKNIYNLSSLLIKNHKSIVPNSFNELEALPGVGHKTASVIMAQAFKVPSFPIDTHIHRLAQRWGLTSGKNVQQTEKDLKSIFPYTDWNKLHLQIIFYGREFCTARGCDGRICKICKEIYPTRKHPVVTKKS